MKILITGGFGYLGTKLSKLLADEGYKIRIFDRNMSKNTQKTNEYEVFLGDVLDKDKLKKACEGVDFVVHLIGINQDKCKENPSLALKINGFGVKTALEAAKEAGVKRFIYVSTFHVYGHPSGNVTEETIPKPLTDYAITKLAGESHCNTFNGDMKCIIIRLSNAYGAPLSDSGWNLAINDFCKQAAENKKIILRTKGQQKRNFIAVSDIARVLSILFSAKLEGLKSNVFNVGGSSLLSIHEAAELVAQTYSEDYGNKVKIEFDKNAIDEQTTDFSYDLSRIKKLGFQPKADMKEEIKETFKAVSGDNLG